MHRLLFICLTVAFAIPAVRPAVAGDSSAAEVELMTVQFEQLFEPMLGAIEARDLTYVELGNGFRALRYKLDRAGREAVVARAANERPFRTLACGHMAAEPTNPATMVNAVIADVETQYNLWFVVLNAREDELLRKTTVKLTGPEEFEIEVVEEEVPYPGATVQLIWFNPETPFAETGVYAHRVTVKSGGKVGYRFFAEPASTVERER